MESWKLGIGLAAVLAAGCDAQVRGDEKAESGNAAAAADSADGKVAIKGEGIDLSIDIPEVAQGELTADGDSKILPPGATLSGVHVQGGAGGVGGNVEMRFRVDRPVEEVAAWYRDSARARDFTIASASTQGAETVLSGAMREGEGRFTVRLAAAGSGTEGRITLSDKG